MFSSLVHRSAPIRATPVRECKSLVTDEHGAVRFLRDPSADKEEIARAIAAERKVESGLVCAVGSMEFSPSFEHRGTHMARRTSCPFFGCGAAILRQIAAPIGERTYFPMTMTWKLSGNTAGRGAFWPSLAAGAGPNSAASM